jgi:hypothetical protein
MKFGEDCYQLPVASDVLFIIWNACRVPYKSEKIHYRPMLCIRSICADWSLTEMPVQHMALRMYY